MRSPGKRGHQGSHLQAGLTQGPSMKMGPPGSRGLTTQGEVRTQEAAQVQECTSGAQKLGAACRDP